MKALILLPAALLVLSAAPAFAQDGDEGEDIGPIASAQLINRPREAFGLFRQLRGEAVQAANAGDMDGADRKLAEADGLVVNHPGLILLRARVAAMRGDGPGAVAQLDRYGRMGLVADVAADATLAAVADTPGFAEAAARIAANRTPVGSDRFSPVATVGGARLVESVVWDGTADRWLVSAVADRTIVQIGEGGRMTAFLADMPVTAGILGLAIDETRGWLWAASAPVPPASYGLEGPPLPATALLRITLSTGHIDAWFSAPDDGLEHGFGDVAVGPDGTAYVADSAGGIYRYAPGAETLEIVLEPGTLASPQGMVVTPDGSGLIVADYATGLHRVELATGALLQLAPPSDASLIGVDGLATDGHAIYAIQNGGAPQRVLKLTPEPDWRGISAVEVIAANLPELDEPTTGLVRNGELVFVSRSQWSEFGEDGAPRTAHPAPAIIGRLRLD